MRGKVVPSQITLEEVWLAYRKAKTGAFFDRNAAHGIKFAHFEDDLTSNLAKIHQLVQDSNHTWADNVDTLGKLLVVPKSISPWSNGEGEPHFRESDPWEDWRRIHSTSRRADAKVRRM